MMLLMRISLAFVLVSSALQSRMAFGQEPAVGDYGPLDVHSPAGDLHIAFRLDAEGTPRFTVLFRGKEVAGGGLGLELAEHGRLQDGLRVVGARRASRDETYSIPVGKASSGRDHHNELVVLLEEAAPPHRKLDIAFRAFDDGVAFRYVLPHQTEIGAFVLDDELTTLTIPDDRAAHLLPLSSHTTSYEAHYQHERIAAIAHDQLIGLPLLVEHGRGGESPVWIAVTEAKLMDYAGMYLSRTAGMPDTFVASLSPLPDRDDGAKVIGATPHASPWRVLMIADDLGRLIESRIVFHLNDPANITDTSWIKPGKTTFPWWNDYVLEGVDFEPGLNTATHKHYIDFCAEHGIPYHSLDGQSIAWYGGPIRPEGPTDITTAVPEIDLPELFRYAEEKGVRLRLWLHWRALASQIDEAFPLYEKWGVEGVMVDFMDRDDQEMVQWYHEVAEKAAQHKLTVTWHGSYKPTGMERTWPNVLTYEGALNQEYNKWDALGTPPEHNLDVAMVRMLAGPVDYHQGGMRSILPADYQPRHQAPPVQGTRGHQLAMYIVYQNHMPMMADYPAAYRDQPDVPFLVRIPTTWDETRALRTEFGKLIVIARRRGQEWYIGAMTASEPQALELPLDFLGSGRFDAEILTDDVAARPTTIVFDERVVSAGDVLKIEIPPSGGAAIRLAPVSE